MSLFTDPRWGEALAHLPDYLGNHVRVSLAALALGLIVSLPLAILTRNRPTPRAVLLALASIVQTVPGLALLALFYPLLLLAASVALAWFGVSFSAFGFLPAMLALALYSMLPVLRNGITGLNGIDPALIEAAKGVGMTARQSLVMVELPLALPVMMAGIRTAAVWVIGTATLSTPIGQTSLGNYIFAGLQTQNWVFVLFGCFASALLALAVDQLLGLIESGLRWRSRVRAALGAAGIAALVAATLVPTMGRSSQNYVVGAKTFAEQYVLSALMRDRLQAAGLSGRRTIRSRLKRDLRGVESRRYRSLRRLFRHALGQSASPHGHQAARGAVGGAADNACEGEHHPARRARFRERLCAGDPEEARRGAWHPHHRRSRRACFDPVDRRRL
ncbi:ABC-type proline/glycine betaine transport system permease subunit [Bradyrhizobium sp. GM22.5]